VQSVVARPDVHKCGQVSAHVHEEAWIFGDHRVEELLLATLDRLTELKIKIYYLIKKFFSYFHFYNCQKLIN
jgi:hypothetical protein